MEHFIEVISSLLVDKFNVDSAELTVENFAKPLLVSSFRMDAIKLTYLLFEVQRTFGVKLTTSNLLDYRFMTINAIATSVIAAREREIVGNNTSD